MRYGMSYKGSKSRVALEIVNALPQADCLVDLFGGGGAITHCACLSGKYKKVIYNELDPVVCKGFKMAVNGEFKNETRWISRDEFFKLKDVDPYVAICWSFGNDLKAYLYAPDIEEKKKALHKAIVFGHYDEMKKYGIDLSCIDEIQDQTKRRLRAYKEIRKITRQRLELQSLESLERLKSLESLERLKRLESLERLEIYNLDYRQVEIPKNSIIYCDIPYKDTSEYRQVFNHDEFYEWARKQDNIFISEYNMPSDFKCVFEIKLNSTLSATDNSIKRIEKIFTNKSTEFEQQLTLF